MKEKKSHAVGRLEGALTLSRTLSQELMMIILEDELCDKADALVREAHLKLSNISMDCLATAQAWQLTEDRKSKE